MRKTSRKKWLAVLLTVILVAVLSLLFFSLRLNQLFLEKDNTGQLLPLLYEKMEDAENLSEGRVEYAISLEGTFNENVFIKQDIGGYSYTLWSMPVESTGTTLTVAFMVEGRVEDGSLVFQSPYPISKETVDYAVLDGKFPQLSLKEERLSSAVTIWLDDQILPLDPIWSAVLFSITDGKPVINYNYAFDLSGVDENGVNDFDRLIYLPRAKELRVVFNNSYRTTVQPDFITGLLLQRWNEE